MQAAGSGYCASRSPRPCRAPRYKGLEASEYLCARYRWIKGSVVDFAPRSTSDLVVCYDVLQYLGDRDAAGAIANLAKLTRAAVYVSALTPRGLARQLRPDAHRSCRAFAAGEWYRRRLRRRFNYLGFGVWLRKDVSAILWDMERP